MAESESKIMTEEAVEVSKELAKSAQALPHNRFSGNGVIYKAKLFGTADVNEPKGDAVCNMAMGLLKSAVKNTGEHKQKILVKISMSGITLLDQVNQLKLYDHAVNKISYIAKDPTDNRAFGYIYTETKGKHMYFGIKTDRPAEATILALKDMFQTVSEQAKSSAGLTTLPEAASTDTNASEVQPAETPDAVKAAETTMSSTEPALGEALENKEEKSVKKDNSSSSLLDLLDDLSFNPTPQPTAVAAPAGQPWPPQNAAALSWGNALPTQNDPFTTQPQQNAFSQQKSTFPQQSYSQPSNQSPFNQPFPQPAVFASQQQPQMFRPQAVSGGFSAANPQSSGLFQQPVQPQTTMTSPFGQQSTQSPAFLKDPFAAPATFQQAAQSVQPAVSVQSTNPFSPGGNQSFGVLQPQQVPHPVQTPAYGQQSNNLFSDLNPLPSNNQQVRKDQFFIDVKNPSKPKMNEMQTSQDSAASINNGALW